MTFRPFCLFYLLVICTTPLHAQSLVEGKYAAVISFEPLFLPTNTIRANAEIHKTATRHAFVLIPEVYFGKVEDRNELAVFESGSYQSDKIGGVGLGLMHKWMFAKADGFYVSYGMIYRNISIRFFADDWFAYTAPDGLDYFAYGPVSDKLVIRSYLFPLTFGSKEVLFRRIMFDYYFGIGYKHSTKQTKYPNARDYDQSIISYAYTGATILAGVKIGYQIK